MPQLLLQPFCFCCHCTIAAHSWLFASGGAKHAVWLAKSEAEKKNSPQYIRTVMVLLYRQPGSLRPLRLPTPPPPHPTPHTHSNTHTHTQHTHETPPYPQSTQQDEIRQVCVFLHGTITEMMKAAGGEGVELVRQLAEVVFSYGEIPTDWEENFIINPNRGKGEALGCDKMVLAHWSSQEATGTRARYLHPQDSEHRRDTVRLCARYTYHWYHLYCS